jgi:hypothetical protein
MKFLELTAIVLQSSASTNCSNELLNVKGTIVDSTLLLGVVRAWHDRGCDCLGALASGGIDGD